MRVGKGAFWGSSGLRFGVAVFTAEIFGRERIGLCDAHVIPSPA